VGGKKRFSELCHHQELTCRNVIILLAVDAGVGWHHVFCVVPIIWCIVSNQFFVSGETLAVSFFMDVCTLVVFKICWSCLLFGCG